MAKLIYTVEVDSDDHETDIQYLVAVCRTFRMITEELSAFGWAGECSSESKIENGNVQTANFH